MEMNKTRQCDECGKFRRVKWTDNGDGHGWLCEDCAKSARFPVEELPVAAEVLPDGRTRLRYFDGTSHIISAEEAAANPVHVDSPYRTVRKDRLAALERLCDLAQELVCNTYALEDEDGYEYMPSEVVNGLREALADLQNLEVVAKKRHVND
ncbi:MAG: hypothetical protein ACYCYO_01780 [Bacilli bacterium]